MKEKRRKIAALILSAIFALFGAFLCVSAVEKVDGVVAASAASSTVEIPLSDAYCTEFAKFSCYKDTHRTRFVLQKSKTTWGLTSVNLYWLDWLNQISVNGKTIAEYKSAYEASGSPKLESADIYISSYGCAPINVLLSTDPSIPANVIDIFIPECYIPASDMIDVRISGPLTYQYKDDSGEHTYVLSGAISAAPPQMEETTYTVSLDGVGQEVSEGGFVTCPTTPTKSATESHYYEFVGWYYLQGDKKVYWNFEENAVYRNLELFSDFREVEKTKYIVTFDPVNGSESASVEVYQGGTIDVSKVPANPVKMETDEAKYAFLGWFNKDTGAPFDPLQSITGNVTIEARYTTTYKYLVTIDGQSKRVCEGDKLDEPQTPTRGDTLSHTYEFIGWYYLDGEDKVYWDFAEDVVTDNLVLMPDFKEIEKTKYVVTFDPANGDESTSVEVYRDNKIDLSKLPQDPEKEEEENCVYFFEGWFNKDMGTRFDFESIINENVSLVAKYQVIRKYLVKINGEEMRVLAGEKLVCPSGTFTKEETESHVYQFDGWVYYREGKKCYWDFQKDTVFSDLTLEPDFKEVEKTKYTVTFDGDNGVASEKIEVYEGALIKAEQIPNNPEKMKDGHTTYRFFCWSADGLVAWDFGCDTVTNNMTLKAYYTTKKVYSVSFDGESLQSYEEGESLQEPPIPNKEATAEYSYTFQGWYYWNEGELHAWDFKTDKVTDDVALLSQYSESKVKYTVSFHYPEDGQTITKNLPWGTLIPYPSVQERQGYRFLGWIDDSGETAPKNMPTRDIHVYINRGLTEYVATLRMGFDVLCAKKYTVETADDVLQALREYLLQINDEEYTYAWVSPLPQSLELEDCTFDVTRQKVCYKMTIVGDLENEEETTKEIVLPWGDSIVLDNPDPVHGRTFLGWQTENEGKIPTKMPTKNLKIVAKWEWTRYTMTVVDGNGIEESISYTVKEGDDPIYVRALFAQFLIPENPKAYLYGWAEAVPTTLPLENGKVYTVVKTPIVYTLTFVGTEGVEPLTFTVETLTGLQLPEIPNRLGYTAKWDKTVSELTLEDATFTAIYTPVEYRITFVGVEGIEDILFTVKTLDEVRLPSLPVREGYTAKWDKKLSDVGLENTTITAIYQPIVYTLTFANAQGIEPISFTVETLSKLTFPSVPEKVGYKGEWNKLSSEIALEDTVVTAVYSAIEYVLTFVGLEESVTLTFTIETIDEIVFPEIPQRDGYTGAWDITPDKVPMSDTTVTLLYTAIEYKITFLSFEKESRIIFTIETLPYLTFPTVPERTGYTAVWNKTISDLSLENAMVEAVYTLCVYTVTFEADCEIDSLTFTVETMDAVVFPEPPDRIGYVSKWSKTPSELTLENVTVHVVYTPIPYTITFVDAEGIEPIVYTVETLDRVRMPAVPERKGYMCVWDKDLSDVNMEDVTITALYTPIVYTLSFACEGMQSISYTVENKSSIVLPELPTKSGYEGRWDRNFALCELGDVELTPVYTAIVYTITFKGVEVEILPVTFTVETMDRICFPEVPLKVGYTGVWDKSPSDIELKDIVVTAKYTPIESDVQPGAVRKFNWRGCFGVASTPAILFPVAIAFWVVAKKKED